MTKGSSRQSPYFSRGGLPFRSRRIRRRTKRTNPAHLCRCERHGTKLFRLDDPAIWPRRSPRERSIWPSSWIFRLVTGPSRKTEFICHSLINRGIDRRQPHTDLGLASRGEGGSATSNSGRCSIGHRCVGFVGTGCPDCCSDLPATFEQMGSWLLDRSGQLPKRVLIVGDGQNTGVKPTGPAFDLLTKQAREAVPGVFFCPSSSSVPFLDRCRRDADGRGSLDADRRGRWRRRRRIWFRFFRNPFFMSAK